MVGGGPFRRDTIMPSSEVRSISQQQRDGRVRPNMRDVAKRAGVSVASVSYVLNGLDRVSDKTRLRVMEAVDELGFVVNQAARTMKVGGSGFGITVGDLRSSFDVDVIRGAQSIAREHATTLLIGNGESSPRGVLDYIELFDQARLQGIIISNTHVGAEFDLLRARRTPFVLVNHRAEVEDHCVVLMDNEAVGYDAARHLIDVGCRRLVWITDGFSQPLLDRRIGIRRAVAESAGVSVEDVVVSNFFEEGGREAARHLATMGGSTRPDGAIAGTNFIGRGLINEMHATTDLRVPADLRLITTDANRLAAGGPVQMSTLTEPGFEMGARALELLLVEASEPASSHRHRRVVLSSRLDPAESSLG